MAASKEKLSELHGVIAEQLTDRIKSGLWAASDVAAAIKFLKDNDITADPGENKALSDLKQQLQAQAKRKADEDKERRASYTTLDELKKIAADEINREFDPTIDRMN